MKRKKIKPVSILIYILLVLLAIIYIAPLLWIVLSSLKETNELTDNPFGLPAILQWGNYSYAWEKAKLGSAAINSVLVCGITLIISIFVGAMAAFAIGRMKFKLSGLMMTYFLLGMMVPVHIVLIPLYVQFAGIGLTESILGLILPYVTFALPMTIFILVGFFRTTPKELFESACMDGCSIYGCFFRIGIPMARTGMFVAGLMTFVGNWNELLMAMVFVSDKAKRTLPVALTSFAGPYKTNYTQMFAAIVLSMIPTIITYCCFSNQIVDGLTQGAVKG